MPNTETHTSTSFELTIYPRIKKVQVTENQKKVIEGKYLKGASSIEAWLSLVAHNIALAELLYHPSSHLWGLFDGVRTNKREIQLQFPSSPEFKNQSDTEEKTATAGSKCRFWLFHGGLASATERDTNFRRFLQNCQNATVKFESARTLVLEWEERFFNLLASWKFLPNSPTLMNAGREIQQLSACYVLPVEDSMEGITNALQAQALIHKSGGGTGFSFERLRPMGDQVKSTSGVASGVTSFMQVFDKMTEVVKQGGNRRGANMGILPYWHPEIMEFINLKNRPGILENFNISVSVDSKFMQAVADGSNYDVINPRTKQPAGQLSARHVFDTIIENAWKSGDPGIIFIDRINNSESNPTPNLGPIEATNPCGEQPLLPNEPCNLGSINVSLFVEEDSTPPTTDWKKLREAVFVSMRFLDNVIDMNNYPLPEIEYLAKTNRRIGLGIMGWAEMLVKLQMPYDSDDAINFAKELMKFINLTAREASEELAVARGVFPNWKNSIYDPSGAHFRGVYSRPRHCARTTIAPTGTIGLAAGVQGTGIEPFYAIAYTRYNAAALEAIKKGVSPEPSDVFFEVNPLFKKVCQEKNFFGMKETDLWEKVEENKKSIRGIPEIPVAMQALFATSHDISVEYHVKMQAAFQEYTDNAVSKTINLPQNASVAEVSHAYELAYRLGCKGVTVYRDGSKQQQVLNFVASEKKVKKARDFSIGVSSEYYEIQTGHGPLHVHIDYDEDGPFRLFTSVSPIGTEISGLTAITGILLSKYLEEGGDPVQILKHLQSIKGDRPTGLGENKINSISHAIAKVLRTHLKKHGWLEPERELENISDKTESNSSDPSKIEPTGLELWHLASASDQCPECFSTNIRFSSGCSGPTCQDCGFSECT